jgi:hypothetical protein
VDDAVPQLREALRIDSARTDASDALVHILRDQSKTAAAAGDSGSSLALLREARNYAPDNPDVQFEWPCRPFTIHNNVVPLHPSRSRKRNSSGSTSCDSAQNESAVEAYYSQFHRLQKIVSSNKCFPITSKSFYFADVNHHLSHFALK